MWGSLRLAPIICELVAAIWDSMQSSSRQLRQGNLAPLTDYWHRYGADYRACAPDPILWGGPYTLHRHRWPCARSLRVRFIYLMWQLWVNPAAQKLSAMSPAKALKIMTQPPQQPKNCLHVEKSFSSFAEFQHALDELIKQGGNHPFRVFNSQTGKNYNEKRSGRKYSTSPVDVTKFEYPYYSAVCVVYTMERQDHVVRVCILYLINVTFPWSVKQKLPPVMTSCRIR